jgi:pSer/pThr/pTyr-binding forkhead associated (FHA) protein
MPRPAGTYRPTFRPPIGLLTVFDDGKADGEIVRLRADRFVIGRTEGDLLLAHDGLVSARHLEITRQLINNVWRWVVSDLETTNGLFVRVSRMDLADGTEFLVGRGRYRFEAATANTSSGPAQAAEPNPAMTRPWGEEVPRARPPVLVELQGGQTAARFPLVAAEYWIGSDPGCTICRADDPFVDPRHVRLSRANKGDWEARNNKSPNGLWLRVPQIMVEGVCLFQIGEQRFRLSAGT